MRSELDNLYFEHTDGKFLFTDQPAGVAAGVTPSNSKSNIALDDVKDYSDGADEEIKEIKEALKKKA